MTDQELLELAARAAGVKKTMWSDKYHIPPFPDGSIRVKPNGWDPLTDDDDALRLAVKLQLAFSAVNPSFIEAAIFKDGEAQMTFRYGTTDSGWNNDPCAAARRAIVRAAAEIGKEMK